MLTFKIHEKNLFHQPRSWIAPDANGYYVIEKAATEDKYQARYDQANLPQELLARGMWLPSYDRAAEVCEQDRKERQRARIAAKAAAPQKPATAAVRAPAAPVKPAAPAAAKAVPPRSVPPKPGSHGGGMHGGGQHGGGQHGGGQHGGGKHGGSAGPGLPRRPFGR